MNRLRILSIFLLVVVMVSAGLPLTESLAKWSRRSAVSQHKRHRHHSRAWWRRHRALLRARRERADERRLQRLNNSPETLSAGRRNAPAAQTSLLSFNSADASTPVASSPAPNAAVSFAPNAASNAVARTTLLPFDFMPPHTWTPVRKSRPGAAVFTVTTPDGRNAGTAVVAPVSLSNAELAGSPANSKTKTVGGLSVTALRRTVIDRMVAEGGWVTNDFVQEMHGRRVFVVLAQTGAPGMASQSWAFYFTEIDGRVYSLATTAPIEFAEPLAAGCEQFMASLHSASDKNLASQK
jgi:hypothetical protein